MSKVIEHTFTRRKEHIVREVPPEELAQLNGLLTTERKSGDPVPQRRAASQSTPASAPSEADDELEELRARYAETTGISPDAMIVERTVGGKARYIKRLLLPDLGRIGKQIANEMKAARRTDFDMADQGVFKITAKALMMHAVVKGANDPTPFYSEASAEKYVNDPCATELVLDLFGVITKINPGAVPKSPGVSQEFSATTTSSSPAKSKRRTSRSA